MSNSATFQKSPFLEGIEKLTKNRKFRSIAINDSGIYHSYLISGAKIKWNANLDFVYSYELRIAGTYKEVNDVLSNLSKDDLTELYQKLSSDPNFKNYIPKSKNFTTKSLISRIITQKNHGANANGTKSITSKLYYFELDQYKNLKQIKQNIKNNLPSIDEIYEAFLEYKKNPPISKNTNIKSKKRLSNIGEIYTALQNNEIMNIYGYSAPDGKVFILKVDDPNMNEYDIDNKTMYKVPNYRLVTSNKKDVEYALKDLVEQGEVELTKKEINNTLKQWTELKVSKKTTNTNTSNIVSPKTIRLESNGNSSRFEIPRVAKHKIIVTDE
uniref:Uncharacterized protein n=1 Tax=Pithovirus LCPAC001 TaxID=2506585 RepID=A0A481Z4H5_9VIRU|nr:MAG: hypothetical protein LCPAC001_00600 [Pithovirus LCPAC001]